MNNHLQAIDARTAHLRFDVLAPEQRLPNQHRAHPEIVSHRKP